MRSLSLLTYVFAAGCAIDATPPLAPLSRPCSASAQVVGVWRSSGSSQLGPVGTTMTFDCDCVLSTSSRLVWARVKGRQRYAADGDTITIEGEHGSRLVRYTRADDTLTLTWPGGDTESLRLEHAITCNAK